MAKRLPPISLTKVDTDNLFALGSQSLSCYFRRGRGNAESGYPSIEFGYCVIAHGPSERSEFAVVAKRVIGTSPDQVSLIRLGWWNQDPNYSAYEGSLTLDVTRDGYWHIQGDWRWDEERYIPGIDGEARLIFAQRMPHGNQVHPPAHSEAPVSEGHVDPALPATPSS